MDCFATNERYSDEGYVDGGRDADAGSDLDFTFYTGLQMVSALAWWSLFGG